MQEARSIGRSGKGVRVRVRMAPELIPQADLQRAERVLAELIARAYLGDHPALLARAVPASAGVQEPEAPAAAADPLLKEVAG